MCKITILPPEHYTQKRIFGQFLEANVKNFLILSHLCEKSFIIIIILTFLSEFNNFLNSENSKKTFLKTLKHYGGFICTSPAFINMFYLWMTRIGWLSLANDYSENHFSISSNYFNMLNKRHLLVLSLLRSSQMTSELITFNQWTAILVQQHWELEL